MASHNDLAIIIMGHKSSPLVKYIVDRDDIPATWICSNVLDFQLFHADPSKASTYHIEFTNLLEQKARNYIESLAIFETLGKFLDFYNPLKLSTLNYLLTRYVTSLNPTFKGMLATWRETEKSIFADNSIFPIFEESRVLHVKIDDVEVPARQHIITREDHAVSKDGEQAKQKKKSDAEITHQGSISGVVDVDDFKHFKLCGDSIKHIEQARGVLFIPTDLLSFHLLVRCDEFTDALKNPESKVALVSPFWQTNSIPAAEKEILERLGVEPTLLGLASKLKDFADAIIIDETDAALLPQLRETGMTVLVEKMDPLAQESERFLERVLKTVSVDLESIKGEHRGESISLGDKLVSILSERFEHKEGKENGRKQTQTPAPADVPKQIEPAAAAEPIAQLATAPPSTPGQPPPGNGGPKPVAQSTSTASVEPPVAATTPMPAKIIQAAEVKPEAVQLPVQPVQAAKPTEIKPVLAQQRTADEVKIDGIAPSLIGELDKVLYPKYEQTIEAIFSSLLSILDQPRLVPAIYKVLVQKLGKLDELNPEARTIDIITYLAAHNPDAYGELFSELLADAMKEEDNSRFEELLHTISLIMSASQVKRQEVLRNFVKDNMSIDNEFSVERTRKILNYFVNKTPVFASIVCKILVEFMIAELENSKARVKTVNNIAFYLLSVDALMLGEAIVTDMPEALHVKMKAILETISSGQAFNNIVIKILEAYQAGEYEALKKALNSKKVPAAIQMAVLKRKYLSQLLKAGSVPLEMVAEKLGMNLPEAEKLIYDAILKGDIAAKMEVVSGKLYIVKDEDAVREAAAQPK